MFLEWLKSSVDLLKHKQTSLLLLLLGVTVKTFSNQNQGQHCTSLNYGKVTTAGCFFSDFKGGNKDFHECCVGLRACLRAPETETANVH